MDLDEELDYMKKYGEDDKVINSARDMLFSTGGKATIDIGKNEKMILPFIGELKEMLQEYEAEFNASPKLKGVLEEFIMEKEEMSEFIWMKFIFSEKNIPVKFTTQYGEDRVCLIKHLFSNKSTNIGRERMDYVTKYIINLRKNINAEADIS